MGCLIIAFCFMKKTKIIVLKDSYYMIFLLIVVINNLISIPFPCSTTFVHRFVYINIRYQLISVYSGIFIRFNSTIINKHTYRIPVNFDLFYSFNKIRRKVKVDVFNL